LRATSLVCDCSRGYSRIMKSRYLIVLLLMPFAAHAAQGYKIVHPDGTVEFTDQPVKNAEEINLPAAQGYQSTDNGTSRGGLSAPAKKSEQKSVAGYSQFSISSPSREESIPNTGGDVSVAVSIAPALQEGHQVVITLDGSDVAKGATTSFSLSSVERGAHLLSASIIDSSGVVIRQADPVTFYVFQQSLLNPNNPRNRP